MSKIFDAICKNRLDEIEQALSGGLSAADLLECLRVSVAFSRVDLVERFLEAGAPVRQDPEILIRASIHAVDEILDLLIEHGAPVMVQEGKRNALDVLTMNRGNPRFTQKFLESGCPVTPPICGEVGITPMESACSASLHETVSIFLRHGADPNGRYGKLQQAPLHILCENMGYHGADTGRQDRFETMKVLLAAGADPREPDSNDMTPLAHIARNTFLPAHHVRQAIQMLVDAGADINAPCTGFSPLHHAARAKNLVGMEAFIAEGADVTSVDGNGDDVLMLFLRTIQPQDIAQTMPILRQLIEAGGNLERENESGETALGRLPEGEIRNELMALHHSCRAQQRIHSILAAATSSRPCP